MIQIDGSFGEGGGQILRTSLALSVLTQKPIHIYNIRKNRPKEGLSHQHMKTISAIAELTGSEVKGNSLHSTEIEFDPKSDFKRKVTIDIGTAGSITLLLQSLMIPLPFLENKTTISVHGGTNVPWSPQLDYLREVTIPTLIKMGYKIEIKKALRGYYPEGNGYLEIEVTPVKKLKAIAIDRHDKQEKIQGISYSTNLPENVSERQKKSARALLFQHGISTEIKIDSEKAPGERIGSGVFLFSKSHNSIIGDGALGARGKRAEEVGQEAANTFLEKLKCAHDFHLSDQLVPYMALAEGESSIFTKSTSHLETNISILEMFFDIKFSYQGDYLKVFGISFENTYID